MNTSRGRHPLGGEEDEDEEEQQQQQEEGAPPPPKRESEEDVPVQQNTFTTPSPSPFHCIDVDAARRGEGVL